MAHATVGAYTKRCHHIHGHSYKFELFLQSDRPNSAQMVSDFRAVKDTGINDFFDSFDHAVMIWEKDIRAPIIEKINPDRHILVPFNPTAEMMAKAFFTVSGAILDSGPKLSGEDGVSVFQVIVHETDTGYAVYRAEDAAKEKFPAVAFDRWQFSDGIKAEWKEKSWYQNALNRLKSSN